jgi:hypothetical protein
VQVGGWDGVKRGLELWVQWVDYGCVLVVCTCSHVIRHHLMNVIYNHIRGREGWFDSWYEQEEACCYLCSGGCESVGVWVVDLD